MSHILWSILHIQQKQGTPQWILSDFLTNDAPICKDFSLGVHNNEKYRKLYQTFSWNHTCDSTQNHFTEKVDALEMRERKLTKNKVYCLSAAEIEKLSPVKLYLVSQKKKCARLKTCWSALRTHKSTNYTSADRWNINVDILRHRYWGSGKNKTRYELWTTKLLAIAKPERVIFNPDFHSRISLVTDEILTNEKCCLLPITTLRQAFVLVNDYHMVKFNWSSAKIWNSICFYIFRWRHAKCVKIRLIMV